MLDLSLVSSEPEGSQEDGLPEDLEQAGTVTLSEEVIPIYLQRLEEADGTYRLENCQCHRHSNSRYVG